MAYIKTDEANRIIGVTVSRLDMQCYEDEIEADIPKDVELGCIHNYLYVDGVFIYDPEPQPEPEYPEPADEAVTYDELAAAIREGVNSYGQ